jgi:hypothetical protein
VGPIIFKAITCPRRRTGLNWVDYLVIAATILTFLAVIAANNPHEARAETRAALLTSSDLPEQATQAPSDPGLIRARIWLMTRQL